MRAAEWTRGVNRAGGTYRQSWNGAERETWNRTVCGTVTGVTQGPPW